MATTATKEKPILFSGEMVRAILAGQKTQTRRVIKPQPVDLGYDCWEYEESVYVSTEAMRDHLFHNVYGSDGTPYGSLYESGGDRLWVRESFYIDDIDYLTGPLPKDMPVSQDQIYYAADGTCCEQIPECSCGEVGKPKWRPSIFMPRWASRITLEITDVRVERVQDITEDDAQAEGVEPGCLTCGENCVEKGGCGYCRPSYRDSFAYLWDQINSKRGFGWDVNPWVWAISFKRV